MLPIVTVCYLFCLYGRIAPVAMVFSTGRTFFYFFCFLYILFALDFVVILVKFILIGKVH